MHSSINSLKIYLFLIGTCILAGSVSAQQTRLVKSDSCPPPFPLAKFYVEPQPDAPIAIRDFKAEHVQNRGDVMAFNRIRVSFYFENRSTKKIKTYLWEDPALDENEETGGGITAEDLLPGESHRFKNTFHTQKGPSIVFRMTEVEFADGTRWKAPQFKKAAALRTTPVCVVSEKWPVDLKKRSMDADPWRSPIFADRILKKLDDEPIAINGVNVERKLIEINRERLDSISICKPDDTLGVRSDQGLDFDIEKYRTFSVNGRVFAYLIYYELVDEKGQFEIGASSASFYVDEGGTGSYVLRCDEGNSIPKVPAWARKSPSTADKR